MSDSVQPQRRQPTRLPRPWDSPGKNTGVGCHFLLQCMKVKSESEVAQSCPTLSDPMDRSLPGSSIHGIFQARVLEWGAIAFSVSMSNIFVISYLQSTCILFYWGFVFLPFNQRNISGLESCKKYLKIGYSLVTHSLLIWPTKVHIVKAVIFLVVMYECESWTVKKTKHWRIDNFELWCCRRLMKSPLGCKEILNPES